MIIAHDVGTTGDKAILLDDDGDLVASVTTPYGVEFGADGRAEQNPTDWWDAFVASTRRLLAESGTAPERIDAVSFSGQMMGVVPVDSAGEVVRPAIIWADTRSSAQCARIVERVGMERAYRITGHRLNATYSLSKLMWLREHEPEAYSRIDTVLQTKDYLSYRLTGVRATDPSDASGTNAYDQVRGVWSDELLEAAGLDGALLPEIVPSTAVVGTVTRDAAAATGLAEGTPVVTGGGDGPMAAMGAGILEPADGAYVYLGSSSWVSVSAPAPLHDPLMRTMTFNHVLPGAFVPTATMQTGGAALQWITGILEPANDERYETLLGEARDAAASTDGLYFLPHLLGERSPYWNPAARASFVGLRMHHERANLMRAVLEGVAFTLDAGLRAFTENGIRIDSVAAIGGATRAELLLELFADVWGVPVVSRRLATEAGAIGAALVAGIGVGRYELATARRQGTEESRHLPDAGRSAAYARGFELFTDAYRRIEPWFDELS